MKVNKYIRVEETQQEANQQKKKIMTLKER